MGKFVNSGVLTSKAICNVSVVATASTPQGGTAQCAPAEVAGQKVAAYSGHASASFLNSGTIELAGAGFATASMGYAKAVAGGGGLIVQAAIGSSADAGDHQ